jgi:hypothetical protein
MCDATTPDWIAAIGAVAAAFGTVGALVYAARAAKAASASARTANVATQNEILPLLLDVPYENYTDHEHEFPWPVDRDDGTAKTPTRGHIGFDPVSGTFAVPVRNVGRGVARIESYEIAIADTGERFAQHGTEAVPVGEDVWLAGRPVSGSDFLQALQRVPSPLHDYAPLIFSVTYTDNAGAQRQRFEMALGSRGSSSAWRVLRTANLPLDER